MLCFALTTADDDRHFVARLSLGKRRAGTFDALDRAAVDLQDSVAGLKPAACGRRVA